MVARRWKGEMSAAYERTYAAMLASPLVVAERQRLKLFAFWPQVSPDFRPRKDWLYVGQAPGAWGDPFGGRSKPDIAAIRDHSEGLDPHTCSPLSWASRERGSFWRAVRWINSSDRSYDGAWNAHMAYSNLYKLNPCRDGRGMNPNDRLCGAQLAACQELLRMEVKEIRPAAVIVMAGVEWFGHFVDDAARASVRARIKDPNRDVASGTIAGLPAVFTPHPRTAASHGLKLDDLWARVRRCLEEQRVDVSDDQ